jgi:hypothetical protein
MTATIVFFALIVLIVLALQRNHTRRRYHRQPLDGSVTATDRDAQRMAEDLTAAGRR